MQRYWIGVASRDHVRKGVGGGFCQLGHGSMAAVRRLTPGDWIAYYSPRAQLDGGEPVQAFTAIGRVAPAEAYQVEMDGGFVAGRRNVDFLECHEAPIRPLIERLGFITNKKNWAYPFRFGLLSVSQDDFRIIAEAMDASLPVSDPMN